MMLVTISSKTSSHRYRVLAPSAWRSRMARSVSRPRSKPARLPANATTSAVRLVSRSGDPSRGDDASGVIFVAANWNDLGQVHRFEGFLHQRRDVVDR